MDNPTLQRTGRASRFLCFERGPAPARPLNFGPLVGERRSLRRTSLILAGVVVIGAALAAALVFRATRPSAPPFATSYFFDGERFARVRPGMSQGEVRDLLGPALWQSGIEGQAVEIWTYSTMPAPVREYEVLEVRFDGSSKVTSASRETHTQLVDPKTGTYSLTGARPPKRPQPLSTMGLEMIQGESPRFGAGEQRYLVQVMASWCGVCTKARPEIEALLAKNPSARPIKLLLVSIDEDKKALDAYLHEHKISHPVAWDSQQSLKGFVRGKGIPRYALLQDGLIMWFDFQHTGHASALADLEWFIRYPDFARHVSSPQTGDGPAD